MKSSSRFEVFPSIVLLLLDTISVLFGRFLSLSRMMMDHRSNSKIPEQVLRTCKLPSDGEFRWPRGWLDWGKEADDRRHMMHLMSSRRGIHAKKERRLAVRKK